MRPFETYIACFVFHCRLIVDGDIVYPVSVLVSY